MSLLNCSIFENLLRFTMKTKRGYPIRPDALRSVAELEKQICKVQNDRTAYMEYQYAPREEDSAARNQEIGGLYQEIQRTKRILKNLDEVVITREVISMRAELILVFEKYKKLMDTYDIEGCLSAVYGREIHLGCEINEDGLLPCNSEDKRLQLNFLDWHLIK